VFTLITSLNICLFNAVSFTECRYHRNIEVVVWKITWQQTLHPVLVTLKNTLWSKSHLLKFVKNHLCASNSQDFFYAGWVNQFVHLVFVFLPFSFFSTRWRHRQSAPTSSWMSQLRNLAQPYIYLHMQTVQSHKLLLAFLHFCLSIRIHTSEAAGAWLECKTLDPTPVSICLPSTRPNSKTFNFHVLKKSATHYFVMDDHHSF
jgi:hypothetical protein